MSFRTHKRRPTSIATDQILLSNFYTTQDGTVLQSAMTKADSPKKHRPTASQVRFTLPDDSTGSDIESELENSFDSTNSADYTGRNIFNNNNHNNHNSNENNENNELSNVNNGGFSFKSQELEPVEPVLRTSRPTTPQQHHRKSTSTAIISDSIREMLNKSPNKNQVFIKGLTGFNKQKIPIPAQIMMPPSLAKHEKQPSYLVFNGLDYEPLEKDESIVPVNFTVKNNGSLIDLIPIQNSIDSKILFHNESNLAVDKELPSTPVKTNNSTNDNINHNFHQIEIPSDLNAPLNNSMTPTHRNNFALDNEEEVLHPSPAAKRQNNQLNRRFSFPPKKANNNLSEDAEITANREIINDGLKIFTNSPKVLPPEAPVVEKEVFSPTKRFHRHKRSQSQVIDFNIDQLAEVPRAEEEPQEIVPQEIAPELPQITVEEATPMADIERQLSIQSSLYDNDVDEVLNLGKMIISENPDELTTVHSADEEAVEDAESESQTESEEESEDENDLTEVLDLGQEILSCTSSPIKHIEDAIASPSSPVIHQPIAVSPNPAKILQEIPLGSNTNCYEINPAEHSAELQHIARIKRNEELFNKITSPLLSQTSYISELSEPFSTASQSTALTYYNEGDNVIDLTKDEDLPVIKEKFADGKVHEVIVIDDEAKPLGTKEMKHQRCKSASGLIEPFELPNYYFNNRSKELVSSNNLNPAKKVNPIEQMCNKTMSDSEDIFDQLRRQKTILYEQHIRLLKEEKIHQNQLEIISKLQEKIRNLQIGMTRPKSFIDRSTSTMASGEVIVID